MISKSPIARKLTILIVCFSTVITILTTGLQLFLDYKKELADIHTQIGTIKTMQVSPLSYSMWTFDSKGIQIIIDNILKVQGIEFLKVTIDERHIWTGGKRVSRNAIDTETAITFDNGREKLNIGTLRIVAGLDDMYNRLLKKAMVIFISNGFKTFFVSLFILFLFQRLVTRHLAALSHYATKVASGLSPPFLSLNRKHKKNNTVDELEEATSAINLMRRNLEVEVANLKQTKNALRESEERFRAIYEHAPVLIDAFDEKGRCVLWNNECEKTFGWTIEEINDHGDALSLFYPDPTVREEVIRTVTTDPDARFREWHPKTKDGRTLDTMWANFLLPDGLTFNLGYDITERKELESRLLQAQKMESIGNFAGGIAHDFNNILSSVMGFTELALDGVDKDSSVGEDLREVHSAGLRAKELVQQILAFARQSDEELKPIQIDIIIKEVIKFIRSTIPTTIEIKHDIASNSAILANATQIHRIMMNLCTNAADAMEKEGGTLEISLQDISINGTMENSTLQLKPGNYVELKVSDEGAGIDRHLIDKIFDPYFTTKGQGEGTGLGLAMVHGIVETYGGEVFVDSVLGRGTVFTILLPTVKRRSAQIPDQSKKLPGGQERILLVDDEAAIIKMTSRLLSQLGYSVATATNGRDALDLFTSRAEEFDLVISDVTMPNMSGDQLSKKLIEIRPDIPVILATGYSKRLSEEDAFSIGVKAFIYKPIEKKELAKTVRKVLDVAST